MKYICNQLYIALVVVILASCKNEPIMFDSSKNFVAFVSSTATISENQNALEIPVMVAALKGSPSVSVSFEVVTDGISNPAVEGTDFTIAPATSIDFPDGTGIANLTVLPIDNAVFTGNKSFKIRITSNSKGYASGELDVVTVVLKDNEHPLAKWMGTYLVTAASYGNPGNWDEAWLVTTEADPEDINNLLITGVGGADSGPLKAKLNTSEMTITLTPGQSLGDVYGYGTTAVYKGTDAGDNVIMDEPLIGVIQDDGSINIDLWGEIITDGPNAGLLYDVFNTTWIRQ
jgi:hypothetical protein